MTKDFEKDIKAEIQRITTEHKHKINIDQPLDRVLLDYLTVRFKLIDTRVRKVSFNPKFFMELDQHPKQKEIKAISLMASRGENINRFQSKKLPQTQFHDHLVNEWNIHHFHLSLKPDKKTGFVKQGNALLFAYVTDEEIIFLGTDTHRKGVFGDEKWIKVLHDHFPEKIEKYKAKDILDVSPKVTAPQRQAIWDRGLSMAMTKVDNVVYHSPGVGRSLSGHSLTVTQMTMNTLRWLGRIETQIEERINEICQCLNIIPEKARFRLVIANTYTLIEETSRTQILEFPQELMTKEELVLKFQKDSTSS